MGERRSGGQSLKFRVLRVFRGFNSLFQDNKVTCEGARIILAGVEDFDKLALNQESRDLTRVRCRDSPTAPHFNPHRLRPKRLHSA
jgi:hypothetical protein